MKVPSLPALSWPVVTAILVNLVPIVGVLFWGWSAFALIVLYWLENVVIGARTLASMVANALVAGGLHMIGVIFIGGFFTVHYGLFCFVHGTFVMALFGSPGAGDGLLDLVGTVRTLFTQQPNLAVGMASIVFWQFVQFVIFLVSGEVRRGNPMTLMAAPYPRIIVLHITIIAGGFVLMALNQPLAGLLVLALIKMWFDVHTARSKPAEEAADAVEGIGAKPNQP